MRRELKKKMAQWLDEAPKVKQAVTWGKPWPKGSLMLEQYEQTEFLIHQNGDLQSEIIGYWPDGSVKWTEHTFIADEHFQQVEITQNKKGSSVPIAENKFNAIYINGNNYQAKISKHSDKRNVLDYIKIGHQIIIQDVRLKVESEGERFHSNIESLQLVKNGSIKAVVQIKGSFISEAVKKRNQFTIYLSFYRDLEELDISYTFEVMENKKVSSISLEYDSPQSGELWNRHVGIINDDNVYFEGVQSLYSRRHREKNDDYANQVAGIETDPDLTSLLVDHARENAIWDLFSVSQLTSNFFDITKKTHRELSAVKIGSGSRYSGSVYHTTTFGGIQVYLDKFWEKYPSEIEISNLSTHKSHTSIYLWTSKVEAMEFQHYDYRDHMLSAYEGMEENRSTAAGIANTSKIKIKWYQERPTKELLILSSNAFNKPAILIESLEDYQKFGVFGIYSKLSKIIRLERQLETLFEFYKNEVEQREWYGFWNYGDFMHTYDPYRHEWLYDFGGYAWQNTELVPNMWLWLYFLRTGRRDVYELAEAMTIHTSEVDVYHSGEYKGLGSRHNVVHWGCQAKETRISMAGLHRYYYFLTGDPRTKEVINEVADNENSFERLEPLREFYEKKDHLIPIRTGPDWVALVSDWYTNWEMTNQSNFNQQIEIGIDCIYNSKHKLLSGPTFMFNPKTYELHYMGTGNVGGYHMIISFGGPQVWIEYAETTNNFKLKEMIAEFGKFYPLSDEEMRQKTDGELFKNHFAWPMFATSMMAYAAKYYDDETLTHQTWEYLLNPELSGVPNNVKDTIQEVKTWKTIKEMPWITTNVVSQWCLNVILCIELIGDKIPEKYLKGEN